MESMLVKISEAFQFGASGLEQTHFGEYFQNEKCNRLRLERVQKCLSGTISERMLQLETKLKVKRRDILLQEKLLWLQKSHNECLRTGYGNPKYFHTSTLIRRRRNKVEALLDEQGNWVEGKEALNDMAIR